MNEPNAPDHGSASPPSPPEPAPAAALSARVDLARLFLVAALAYCTVKLVLLAILAWNTQFVMDEFSQAAYSIKIPAGFYENLDPVKTVLYVYFYQIARLLSDNAVELMHLARLQTLALALGIVGFVWATVRNLGARRPEALFAVCVLLAFSNFMERAFRIRSDNVAVFLACAALWLATRRGAGCRGALGAGALVGAAFCATQKAAYFFLAFGLAYLVHWISAWRREASPWPGMLPGLAFAAGWAASALAYAVYFGGAEFARVLGMVFSSPAEVALHADEYYRGLSRYWAQTLLRNPLAYGLSVAGLLAAVWRWRTSPDARRLALVVTLVMTSLVVLHNQPWPYVFLMMLPFQALWSAETLGLLADAPVRRREIARLALLAVLALSLGRNFAYLDNHNLDQCRVVAQAESLLAPDDRYADGIGMVATRHMAVGSDWWDAMNITLLQRAARAGDLTAFDTIFLDRPKVWIYTYRLEALTPFLGPYLADAYVRVYPNVLLAGRQLTAEPARFVAYWPGSYRLYGEDGQPLDRPYRVGGQERHGEIELYAGVHQVALAPETGVTVAFLLPSGLSLPRPLPSRGPFMSLFPRVYEF